MIVTQGSQESSRGIGFLILVNVLVLIFLLMLLEGAARLYIGWTRKSHSAGMTERTMYLSYKPFVMYGPDWDQEFSDKEDIRESNICRILLVGGSVAQGFPIAVLEEEFNKPFTRKQFQVLNVGTGGYEARQEVIVASIWGPKVAPHIIVSLDGANDLVHRLRVQKAGGFYLNDAYELFLTQPFFAPIYYILGQSQFYNGMVRFWQKQNILGVDFYDDAIPIYIEAQHSLNVLAKGLGAKRLMVLQPFSGFKSPPSETEAAFDLFKYREKQVKHLYEGTDQRLRELADMDRVQYLDGRYIYDGMSSTVFVDDVHLTDLGYSVLAQRISEKLQKEITASGSVCGAEAHL